MSAISAKEVKALRDRTGAGMLACRDALTESNGDIDKAVEILRASEARIAAEQASDRPENVRERIVQGKLDKWLDEVVLLRQAHVNPDKHDGKTIEELRAELSAETRENVVIRRYARFAVGS